jgi:uncharacterized protein YgiM (DUF1202 family)
MKKIFIILIMGLLAAAFASAQVVTGGTLYVAVKTLSLKSSTGFFASNMGTLNYGDRVTVIQVNGKFVEVRSTANSSLTGWTPSANLSAKQIISGNTNVASASEIALAGKGFNQEVEDSYKKTGTMNYDDVDRTEAITVQETIRERFLEDGRLAMGD